jgi:hypothetical protein
LKEGKTKHMYMHIISVYIFEVENHKYVRTSNDKTFHGLNFKVDLIGNLTSLGFWHPLHTLSVSLNPDSNSKPNPNQLNVLRNVKIPGVQNPRGAKSLGCKIS